MWAGLNVTTGDCVNYGYGWTMFGTVTMNHKFLSS